MPAGLHLSRTAKVVSRAFDDALAAAGGSLPTWLILLALRSRPGTSQREVAAGVGIKGATATHHLNAMESAGLVRRHRDEGNRRVQVAELTPAGVDLFDRLRETAIAFDRRLRSGLTDADAAELRRILGVMAANVGAVECDGAPGGTRRSGSARGAGPR